MINVVGAEQRAEHFLHQVVVFVGGFGAAVDRQGVGAVALIDLDEAVCDILESFIPGDLAPLGQIKCLGAFARFLRRFPNERCGHALGMIDIVVAEASLDAQVAVVDRRVERGGDLVDKVILAVQFEGAADAAVGTGGG